DPDASQAFASEDAPERERLIREVPGVRVQSVRTTEARQELTETRREPRAERERRRVRFFELDPGMPEDEVAVEAERGIHRGTERKLEPEQLEAGSSGIVGSGLMILFLGEERSCEGPDQGEIGVHRGPSGARATARPRRIGSRVERGVGREGCLDVGEL